ASFFQPARIFSQPCKNTLFELDRPQKQGYTSIHLQDVRFPGSRSISSRKETHASMSICKEYGRQQQFHIYSGTARAFAEN
ncbi:MAG: hypothetical protein IJC54_07980, partial [Clostridia bacterium]|nr:hypothetical protein [Clostridia bacterium]